MSQDIKPYKETDEKLKKIFSPSFCFAKWYHSNIYFQTGETHSCYHPRPHKIDLKEIEKDPSCLHNTQEKKKERAQMLKGERPSGCQYCWNIEDLDKGLISDRHIRNNSLNSEPRIQQVKTQPADFHVLPDYIEVSFSNLCNFKCGYCHPKASSRYYNEIEEHGPYKNIKNHRCDINWFKIYPEEDNPYLEAWWKWWPELRGSLKILRITGGEPLLQKSTYRMLDLFEADPMPNLELNVNSNLGSPANIVEKFCDRIAVLRESQKIGRFKLYTSIDTWGPQAEYIRTGLKLPLFEENIKTYLKKTTTPLNLMITFNIFSLFSFRALLEKILQWRSEFYYESPPSPDLFHRVRFDISYLKEPLQYDINILPKDFMTYMDEALDFLTANMDDNRHDKFSYLDHQRFLRIYEYMKDTRYPESRVLEGQRDFYHYFTEQDRRRGTRLLDVFPEIESFWQHCRKL